MAIKYPYDPSQLTENETLYEELIKIRRYLDKNPIYKIYNSTEEASKLIGIYELDLVDVPEGTELTKDDVVLFANSMFAVVTVIDLETRTFTVKDVQSIKGPKGDKGDTGAQGPEGPKGEPGGVPVADFNDLKRSVAENVKGIAHLNEIKQDKFAQVDLDNIASINQMKDDIKGKANQSDLTTLASKVETNTTYLPKLLPVNPNQEVNVNFENYGVICINPLSSSEIAIILIKKDGTELSPKYVTDIGWHYVNTRATTTQIDDQTFDISANQIRGFKISKGYGLYYILRG